MLDAGEDQVLVQRHGERPGRDQVALGVVRPPGVEPHDRPVDEEPERPEVVAVLAQQGEAAVGGCDGRGQLAPVGVHEDALGIQAPEVGRRRAGLGAPQRVQRGAAAAGLGEHGPERRLDGRVDPPVPVAAGDGGCPAQGDDGAVEVAGLHQGPPQRPRRPGAHVRPGATGQPGEQLATRALRLLGIALHEQLQRLDGVEQLVGGCRRRVYQCHVTGALCGRATDLRETRCQL